MKTPKSVYVEDFHRAFSEQGLYPWLMDAGSFMQRLERHGITDAAIRILQEGWDVATAEELAALNFSAEDKMWVREVIIASGDVTWMYARTVIPQATLTGKEQELQRLETRSLGSILFKYKNLQRSQFEIFALDQESLEHQRISHYTNAAHIELWGRRSTFFLGKKTLLLTEVFFPTVGAL